MATMVRLLALLALLGWTSLAHADPRSERRLNKLADLFLAASGARANHPKLSEAGNRAWVQRLDKMQKALDKIPEARLDQQAKLTRGILSTELRNERAFVAEGWIKENLSGVESIALGTSSFIATSPRTNLREWLATIKTLERSGAMMAEVQRLFEQGMKEGRLQPRPVVHDTIEALSPLAGRRGNPLLGLQAELGKTLAGHPRLPELQARLRRAVSAEAIPGHQRLIKFLRKQYLPQAPERLGLDQGRYLHHMAIHLGTSDYSPEKLEARGKQEVSRLQAELWNTARRIDPRTTSLPAFMARFNRRQRFENSAEALEATGREIKPALRWARSMAPVPRNKIVAAAVPRADQATTAAQYWNDEPGQGQMQLNVTNLLPDQVRYELATLVTHEVGAHHLQQLYRDKLAGQLPGQRRRRGGTTLPAFRRDEGITSTAMDEGYALYTEQWRDDHHGFTPEERVGFLVDHLLRAARLVIDTGLHTGKLSRPAAVKYLMKTAFYTRGMAEEEVKRYVNWPGQALAYYTGKDQLLQTRKAVQNILGRDFDARKFHAKILSLGAVPPHQAHGVLMSWARRRASQLENQPKHRR